MERPRDWASFRQPILPLKAAILDFLEGGVHEINDDKLLSFGIRLANEKIKGIQEKIAFLEEGKRQIERTSSFQEQKLSMPTLLPARCCFVEAYEGTLTTQAGFERIHGLMQRMTQWVMKPGYEMGFLSIYRNGQEKRYVFVELENGNE